MESPCRRGDRRDPSGDRWSHRGARSGDHRRRAARVQLLRELVLNRTRDYQRQSA